MDVLSRLIEKRMRKKKLDTYQVHGATSITHLIYIDDALVFSKAKPKSIHSIKALQESSLFTPVNKYSKSEFGFKYMV